MARDDSLMFVLLQIVVIFLILLLISFATPKLQPLLYTSIFFIVLLYVLTTVIFPFSNVFITLFEVLPDPFTKQLIGSAVLFFLSELIAEHIEEAGFKSFASISRLAVKISILLLWMEQITELVEILSSLINK